jgi:hypothetical protein
LLATSNPSFFLSVPDMNPRTLWGRQSTDLEISSSVAPLLRNRSDVIFAAFLDLVRFSSSLAIGGSPLSGTPNWHQYHPRPAIGGLHIISHRRPDRRQSNASFAREVECKIHNGYHFTNFPSLRAILPASPVAYLVQSGNFSFKLLSEAPNTLG